MNFFKKRIPIIYTLLLAIICSGLSFILFKKLTTSSAIATEQYPPSANGSNCDLSISRLKGYMYIQPLIAVSKECEAQDLVALKNDITNLIENEKKAGVIINASVFIKEFSNAHWTSVNSEETYLPGSLFKLPVMFTILRMGENDPSFLNKKILYNPQGVVNIKQTYESKTIRPGQSYTVKELLTYMIAYSDNNATQLLNRIMNPDMLIKVFADLGLTPPKPNMADYMAYTISAHDYSIFMNALYNAAYLNINNSEFATSLLAQCNFKDGLVKGLPADVKIAHKFGEAGNAQFNELHETGIVYINNNTYLITVMTKGNDVKKLAETISEISRITYARMKQNA